MRRWLEKIARRKEKTKARSGYCLPALWHARCLRCPETLLPETAHWNVDNARGALQPTIGGTLWLIIWFAFAIYVVKAPWFFLVLAAG